MKVETKRKKIKAKIKKKGFTMSQVIRSMDLGEYSNPITKIHSVTRSINNCKKMTTLNKWEKEINKAIKKIERGVE